MNKAELIALVAEKTGFTKKDAEKAVNATMSSIEETLVKGERVQLIGFGTFVRERLELEEILESLVKQFRLQLQKLQHSRQVKL